MGINVGAFVCNFAAAFVRNYFDAHPDWGIKGWNAAFCTAGVGMLCGLVIFLSNYGRFAAHDLDTSTDQGPRESLKPLWFECLAPAAALAVLAWFLGERKLIPFSAPTGAFLGACIPVVVFFLRVWRGQTDPDERRRVAALLVVYVVIVVFFMSFHLNTTALNFWARDDTHREPTAIVRVVTDQFEEFAENAPPKYFDNADAKVPRPAKSSFIVVDDVRFKKLSEENKLWQIRDESASGQKKVYVHVTQETLDKIYARADSNTPILPEGQPLKLVNTELYQSINPAYVVLFTPLLVGFFALLRPKGMEPSTPGKIGLGLLINAGAPLMMFLATLASNHSAHKVSSWWLFGTYAVTTVGELCLSPMGLSLVSKVSPPKITAFMMGGFFLAISIGNKLSGIFGEAYTTMDHYVFWMILAVCNLAFGIFVFMILGWLKRQMGSALH
jgi:POT family proton-dependent oligopeptide transporter